MENEAQTTDIWQVEANGSTFDGTFEDLAAWISDGSVLRIDRVRKGNLRWIEAGKVPALLEFFNAKDASEPPPPVITTTKREVLGVPSRPAEFTNNQPTQAAAEGMCAVHTDAPARWKCDTCTSEFCKACPNSYGANVKICPFCGAMCSAIETAAAVAVSSGRVTRTRTANGESFGFGDFANALAHPFKFKTSLIVGAIAFGALSVGQAGFGFGGMFVAVGGVFCMLLANMISFGALANTVENFSQGKLDANFMPSFDDFSIWDDVVHPFFLMIGAYISSFGPFIAVCLVAFFMIVGAVKNELTQAQDPSFGGIAAANKVADIGRQRQAAINAEADRQRGITAKADSGEVTDINDKDYEPNAIYDEEKEFENIQQMIAESRKQNLESTIGKLPETKAQEQQAMLKSLLGKGIVLLLLLLLTGLWGIFYYPAACAVAGYTRSFAAAVNPLVGLDTIKRLGGTYVLILIMSLLLVVATAFVGGIASTLLAAFDMPSIGNIPATFISALVGFYTYVVFACTLGYALFKKAEDLDLPS
ncbi:MAG: hypothetical protein JNL64_11925 [Blastocatellia bacterium]|nr:hypothetical protein [Blastocatellia bacterium]